MKAYKAINAVLESPLLCEDFEVTINVEVDFDYTAGYPAIIRACPGECEPGCPDEVFINSVAADGAQEFEICNGAYLLIRDGSDLKQLLSAKTMDRLTEQMYEEADRIIEEMNEP